MKSSGRQTNSTSPNSTSPSPANASPTSRTHFDAIIVGAGLSGIGLACHLRRKCKQKSFAILESRKTLGGTWDLFRYPGVRSDSDMSTMSYNFKPWRGEKDIASGRDILEYLRQTATEFDLLNDIRYEHKVQRAEWCSKEARWKLEIEHGSGERSFLSCNLLLSCAGYYRYDKGHTPKFAGQDDFQHTIVHPQHWPEDLDYQDKRVVVIGSGATAVTLVPTLAEKASHTIMLQRSPTYMLVRPDAMPLSKNLKRFLPAKLAHAILRWWNSRLSHFLYQRTRTQPERVKRFLLRGVREQLGESYDIQKDFVPTYNPWDQRLCLVPNGDLFEAIKSGRASVVTDEIERFTSNGILLKSGRTLEADIVVTATGLSMLVQGGMEFSVDEEVVDLTKTFTYKGIMNSGVPNMITTFGYVNASWTLRSDMIADFACRLIKHMDRLGARQVTPKLLDDEKDMSAQPFITCFSSNYVQRALHLMPRQGDREPWLNPQDYVLEQRTIGRATFDDARLVFET